MAEKRTLAEQLDRWRYRLFLRFIEACEEKGIHTIVGFLSEAGLEGRRGSGQVYSRLVACQRRGWIERGTDRSSRHELVWLITEEGRAVARERAPFVGRAMLTSEEAAAYLGYSSSTFGRHVGVRFPGIREGQGQGQGHGQWFFEKSELPEPQFGWMED